MTKADPPVTAIQRREWVSQREVGSASPSAMRATPLVIWNSAAIPFPARAFRQRRGMRLISGTERRRGPGIDRGLEGHAVNGHLYGENGRQDHRSGCGPPGEGSADAFLRRQRVGQ